MKRLSKIQLAAAVIILLAGNSFGGTYSGGSGEHNDPYLIGSVDDIIEMSDDVNDWDKHFVMTGDINMGDYTFATAVIAWDADDAELGFQGTGFTGVFDGGCHIIFNLTIDTGGERHDFLGLFGTIDTGSEVKNVVLENVSIVGGDSTRIGGLCGINRGVISGCYSEGLVCGDAILGGLCGVNLNTLNNCWADGSISGGHDCRRVGGLCGANGGTLNHCYAMGAVSGRNDCYDLGGLCGKNWGTITNCYAVGPVSGENDSEYLGGLVGGNYEYGNISNCYSRGDVSGEYSVGGLVGYNEWTVLGCFWDRETSGQDWSDGGIGLLTKEMRKNFTFTNANWDFVSVWNIGENQTYPYLRVCLAGDINQDKIVNLFDFAMIAEQWMNCN